LTDARSMASQRRDPTAPRSALGRNHKPVERPGTGRTGDLLVPPAGEIGSQWTHRWREMDLNFRFLVVRPSNRHGRRDCCLENGSGSVGEPKVRIHLPPAESRANFISPHWVLTTSSHVATGLS